MAIVDHPATTPVAVVADNADGRDGTNALPMNSDIASARLPASYEQAKVALASCASIDECDTWANKAEALASYAKMADDDTLRQYADRIQARAVRRMGELLKQYDGRPDNALKQKDGALPLLSQAAAAEAAGISEHKRKQAVRVANVPAAEFEAAIESDNPATVTALAERGKVERPKGFYEATRLIGTVERFAEFCTANDPETVAGGVLPHETADLLSTIALIDAWLDRFVVAANPSAATVKAKADRAAIKVPKPKPGVAAAADRAEQAAMAKRGK